MRVSLADMAELDCDAAFMAEIGGQVVGFVDVKDYGNEAHIENLVVLRVFRRRGTAWILPRFTD